MKKNLTLLSLALICFLATESFGQKFASMDPSPADISYLKTSRNAPPVAKVIYSRPQLKGRSVESLAKPGKVWRTGANETTEIKFFKDVKFGGKEVKAGTYSLYTIPGEDKWQVILNTGLDTWGAYAHDKSKDILTVDGKVSANSNDVEAFSIAFEADGSRAKMHMAWGKTIVTVPVEF